MSDASIRTLRGDEREAVLTLLDEWKLSDGWRGRDYFRRYIEHDPTYVDENFVVAEEGGALVACVQIFPRLLRVGATAVPTGGIGSVFTSEKARGSGVASRLLVATLTAMRARGFELSLLFASRHDFYARLGWVLWPRQRSLWLRTDATAAPAPSRRIDDFDPARDLDAVMALYARYSAPLAGTVVRERAYWLGQLAFAGNPSEEFLVARDAAGHIEAYARASLFEGFSTLLEFGRGETPAAVAALADLVLQIFKPRGWDPAAERAGRPSAEFRRTLLAPAHEDAALDAVLAERSVAARHFEERASMLQVLDAAAFARRIGDAPRDGETTDAFLRRVLPPERLVCWPADRF